jgi:enoyl-CoA hydratase/carnithine racemase
MSQSDLCTYQVDRGVCVISFNRPDHANGMTGAMEVEYFQLLKRADEDHDVRAIVVTGVGRTFCPGADLGHRAGDDAETLPNRVLPVRTPLEIRKPMIAAINGACAGVGLAYALQCDVRFAAAGTKLTTAFSRRGLVAEYGMAWLIVQIAGRGVALDLLLSGRVFLADEARALGLVHRVVAADDLMDEALIYARELVENVSPASMATIKRQVSTESGMSAKESCDASMLLMRDSWNGPDLREGMTSFLERRPPAFAPLGEGTIYGWMSPPQL